MIIHSHGAIEETGKPPMRTAKILDSGGLYRRGARRRLRRQRGIGVIGWLLMLPVALIVLLILAVGFYEGRKAYWDSKVREMCAKDGGTRVHERVTLTKAEYDRLGGGVGTIPLYREGNVPHEYPYVIITTDEVFRENDPRVYKSETQYFRQADKKVLATSVRYVRVGGDFPTYAHPSSFLCPDQTRAVAEEKTIFSIEGFNK